MHPFTIKALTCGNSFGGFATKYIKGKFFMDVHPPLAKMLIALTGWLAGFDGGFDFKEIGKDYIEPGVPYVAMRMFPAICGILLIPCMFFTLKAVGCRTMTATMGAGLIIFGSYMPLVSWSALELLVADYIQKTVFSHRLASFFLILLSSLQPLSPSLPFRALPISTSLALPKLSS